MTFKNALILLLILALGGSLVLNYFFYKKAFIPFNQIKLDPAQISYYPQDSEIEKQGTQPTVMYYGDSRTLSWPVLNTTDYRFVNRAIGNQTSTQILQRFDAHVTSHEPEVILVQMCVNDLKMIPLFPTQRDDIIKSCKENIRGVITNARSINAKIALSTVFPLGNISILRQALGTTETSIVDGIDEINSFINTLAADDVKIFDSYSLLKGNGRKINPIYSQDWLHLNSLGYAHLNNHLAEFLKQMIETGNGEN